MVTDCDEGLGEDNTLKQQLQAQPKSAESRCMPAHARVGGPPIALSYSCPSVLDKSVRKFNATAVSADEGQRELFSTSREDSRVALARQQTQSATAHSNDCSAAAAGCLYPGKEARIPAGRKIQTAHTVSFHSGPRMEETCKHAQFHTANSSCKHSRTVPDTRLSNTLDGDLGASISTCTMDAYTTARPNTGNSGHQGERHEQTRSIRSKDRKPSSRHQRRWGLFPATQGKLQCGIDALTPHGGKTGDLGSYLLHSLRQSSSKM